MNAGKYFFGAMPDLVDRRDVRKSKSIRTMFGFQPLVYSNTVLLLDRIYDQGSEGACVSNAVAQGAALYVYLKTSSSWLDFSRRWIMLNAQSYDEWPGTSPSGDDGTSARAAMKACNKKGLCLNATLPYVAGQRVVSWTDQLRSIVAEESSRWFVDVYRSCMVRGKADLRLVKQAVMQEGSCNVTMFLPEQFFDVRSNAVIEGGERHEGMHSVHQLLVTGWREESGKKVLEIVNSWGKGWGHYGTAVWEEQDFVRHCQSAWAFSVMRR